MPLYITCNFTGKSDFQTFLEHLLGKNHAMSMKVADLALFSLSQSLVEYKNSTFMTITTLADLNNTKNMNN